MINKYRILSILFVSLFLSSTLAIGVGMMSVPQGAYSNTDQGAVPKGDNTAAPAAEDTPVSILVFTEFADTTTAAPYNEFRNTIDAIENTFGPEFDYDNLTSFPQLATTLPSYDILLLPEQENMNQTDLIAITNAWTSPLTDFVNDGGIVIALDCNGAPGTDLGPGPTMQILNETGLMEVYTPYDGVGWPINLVEPTDALARGVAASWSAPDGSVRFVTPDATVVVDDGASAIVAHKIIGAGHVVLLGFDLWITEPNSEILLANAIRLHRHVVFDASHNTIYRITSGFSLFAEDLVDNGFAVSSMDNFDADILQAAEVLVISIGDYHYDSYTSQEVDAIEAFVSSGGGLFILSDFVQHGNVTDPVNERFGFVRNKTSILYDSDDFNAASSGYAVIYDGSENIMEHPITENVSILETWSGTGLDSYPSNGVPLIVTDSDGTSTYDSWIPADGVVFAAAATYDQGRVVFIGDTGLFTDADIDIDGTDAYFDTDSEYFARNTIRWLSANRAPTVTLTFPNGGERLNGTQSITWNPVDFDNDYLTFDILYSDNNGSDWSSLASGIAINQYEWNTTLHDDGSEYMIRVIVSDGEFSANDDSDSVFEIDNRVGSGLPFGIDLITLMAILGIIAVLIILGYLFNKKRKGDGKPAKKSGAKKKKKKK